MLSAHYHTKLVISTISVKTPSMHKSRKIISFAATSFLMCLVYIFVTASTLDTLDANLKIAKALETRYEAFKVTGTPCSSVESFACGFRENGLESVLQCRRNGTEIPMWETLKNCKKTCILSEFECDYVLWNLE